MGCQEDLVSGLIESDYEFMPDMTDQSSDGEYSDDEDSSGYESMPKLESSISDSDESNISDSKEAEDEDPAICESCGNLLFEPTLWNDWYGSYVSFMHTMGCTHTVFSI
jgi:hypothetical protein